MQIKTSLLLKSISALTLVPIAFFGISGPTAFAAETDQISAELLDQVSIVLDTDLNGSTITEDLQDALVEAIESEVIDEVIIEETENAIDEGVEVDLSEELTDNQTEQEEIWVEQAPLWAAAFEAVKADFQVCREASANARECAKGLGFKLQIAKESATLASIDLRLAELSTLSAEEQITELTELTELQRISQEKLSAAEAKLTKFTGVDDKTATEIKAGLTQAKDKLKKSEAKVQEEVDVLDEESAISESPETETEPGNESGSTETGNDNGNSQGNSGSGNSGASDKGNSGNGKGNSGK